MTTKITEKFEFKTDVIQSYNGEEQRIKLRQIPRHYLTFDYSTMDEQQTQWVSGLLRNRQDGVIHIPMWHNTFNLTEYAGKGSKALYINQKYLFGLRNCDALMCFAGDSIKGINETYLINTIEARGLIGLKNALEKEKFAEINPIVPLIRCAIQPVDNFGYCTSNVAEIAVNFEDILYRPTINFPNNFLYDFDEKHEGRNFHNLPLAYKGTEVFTEVPNWIGDKGITFDMEKNTVKLDNETGKFKYDVKSNLVVDKTRLEFLLPCRENISNFIRFFHRCEGRLKAFYAPSWVNDITLYDDLKAGLSYFYIDFDSMSKYYNKETLKKKVIVFLKDGTNVILDIMGYSNDVVNGRRLGKIFLGQNLTRTIPKSSIYMISFFNLYRFDDDVLQIDYETTEVATVNIVIKEVIN